MKCRIKICGLCRAVDVEFVSQKNIDFGGMLIDMPSPRSQTVESAAALAELAELPLVLLFMDAELEKIVRADAEIAAAAVQLHGNEPPEFVNELRNMILCDIWKCVHLPADGQGDVDIAAVLAEMQSYIAAGADKILLDTVKVGPDGKKIMGGTGAASDWDIAAELVGEADFPVMIAGGINPDNAAEAVRRIRPWGIDLSSGAEDRACEKSRKKINQIIDRVARAQEDRETDSEE